MTKPPVYATPPFYSALHLLQFARAHAQPCPAGYRGVVSPPGVNQLLVTTLNELLREPALATCWYECGHVHAGADGAIECASAALLLVATWHLGPRDNWFAVPSVAGVLG